jgi:AcrR family transcriptional regulator
MSKKEIILKAARKLFSQFGLKKVTTDDIAIEAKISKATIYKYFKNKSEIFSEVIYIETNLMLDLIRKAVSNENNIDDKFKAILRTKINKIHSLINFYRVTQKTWGDHWPYIAEMHEYFMMEEKKIIRDIMILGNRQGILDIKDTELQAHIFTISLKSIEYPWSLSGYEKEVDKIVNLIVDTFMNGVKINKVANVITKKRDMTK